MTMQIAYMRQPVLWHILLARLSSRQVYMGLLVPKNCIGLPPAIKQWGYADWIEGGNPVNVTLPLPFPKNDYLIVACAYGGIDNFRTAALNTVTSNITSNAKYQLATYDYNRRYNYIAIGF